MPNPLADFDFSLLLNLSGIIQNQTLAGKNLMMKDAANVMRRRRCYQLFGRIPLR